MLTVIVLMTVPVALTSFPARPGCKEGGFLSQRCKEGVFLLRRNNVAARMIASSPSLRAPAQGSRRGIQPPSWTYKTSHQPQSPGRREDAGGLGGANWGGGCSGVAVNSNAALHRWERSSRAATKHHLKLPEHFAR